MPQRERRPCVLGEVPPLADVAFTHGICPAHFEQSSNDLAAVSRRSVGGT